MIELSFLFQKKSGQFSPLKFPFKVFDDIFFIFFYTYMIWTKNCYKKGLWIGLFSVSVDFVVMCIVTIACILVFAFCVSLNHKHDVTFILFSSSIFSFLRQTCIISLRKHIYWYVHAYIKFKNKTLNDFCIFHFFNTN